VPRSHAAKPIAPTRRKFGSVSDAVVQVLGEARADLRVSEVQSCVERILEGQVSSSSVKNCLTRGSERKHPLFERVGHGRYRLIR
jgi:hypothetical protein